MWYFKFNVWLLTLQPNHPCLFPLSPLPPISSLSWFASISLLDGWGYGFSFSFWSYFLWLQWCILTVACIEAVHAISHPQLSVSLSLTLNHCTVLCEKGKKIVQPSCAGSHSWISKFSRFHFLSLSLGDMSVCVTVLSRIVAVLNAFTRRHRVNYRESVFVMLWTCRQHCVVWWGNIL